MDHIQQERNGVSCIHRREYLLHRLSIYVELQGDKVEKRNKKLFTQYGVNLCKQVYWEEISQCNVWV